MCLTNFMGAFYSYLDVKVRKDISECCRKVGGANTHGVPSLTEPVKPEREAPVFTMLKTLMLLQKCLMLTF